MYWAGTDGWTIALDFWTVERGCLLWTNVLLSSWRSSAL